MFPDNYFQEGIPADTDIFRRILKLLLVIIHCRDYCEQWDKQFSIFKTILHKLSTDIIKFKIKLSYLTRQL